MFCKVFHSLVGAQDLMTNAINNDSGTAQAVRFTTDGSARGNPTSLANASGYFNINSPQAVRFFEQEADTEPMIPTGGLTPARALPHRVQPLWVQSKRHGPRLLPRALCTRFSLQYSRHDCLIFGDAILSQLPSATLPKISLAKERWQLLREGPSQLPMVLIFASASLGVLVAEYSGVTSFSCGIACAIALATSFLAPLSFRWHLLWVAIASLFASMHAANLRTLSLDRSHSMATSEWTPVVFEAIVDSVPRWRPDLLQYEMRQVEPTVEQKWQTLLEVRMVKVRDRSEWKEAFGQMNLSLDSNRRDLFPGDRIRVFGQWQQIPKPTNPGQFDQAAFYRRKGQFVRVRSENDEQVQKIGIEQAWRLDRWMGRILEQGDRALHRYVRLDQAPLASALVLGQRDQVEWELQESLLATGTMHMLAISGLHVEMVAMSLVTVALYFRLPRKTTLLLISGCVIGYGVLCGAQPPVIRAVVLVVSVCVARWMGRATNGLNLLAFAGLILLIHRTSNLFDIGTQLSFLAVAMLSLLSMQPESRAEEQDPLQRVLYESLPGWRRWTLDGLRFSWEMLRTSFWVWLITTPLVLSTFHVVAPIAIVLNLLLWLPLLIALLSGLGIVVFGWWLPPLGWLLGIVCASSLWVTRWVILLAEQIPGGHCWIPAPPLAWTLCFYVLLLASWIGLGFARHRRRWAGFALAAWCVLGSLPSWIGPQGKVPLWQGANSSTLSATFVNVGHGSAVILQCPDGSTWLYDAGRMGDSDRSFQNIAGVLWHEGIARIDGIFLSHADSDHYNAIEGLTKRFAPRELVTTVQVTTHSSPHLRTVLQQLQRYRVELSHAADGGSREVGGVRILAIHPPVSGVGGSDNANSLCLRIEYGERSLLLTGDLESPGTDRLLQSHPPCTVDVLMAPHHGSVSQDPAKLLAWCRPTNVVISGGARAVGRKVIDAYRSDGGLHITHRDGAIRVEFDASGHCRIFHWSNGRWEQH